MTKISLWLPMWVQERLTSRSLVRIPCPRWVERKFPLGFWRFDFDT